MSQSTRKNQNEYHKRLSQQQSIPLKEFPT